MHHKHFTPLLFLIALSSCSSQENGTGDDSDDTSPGEMDTSAIADAIEIQGAIIKSEPIPSQTQGAPMLSEQDVMIDYQENGISITVTMQTPEDFEQSAVHIKIAQTHYEVQQVRANVVEYYRGTPRSDALLAQGRIYSSEAVPGYSYAYPDFADGPGCLFSGSSSDCYQPCVDACTNFFEGCEELLVEEANIFRDYIEDPDRCIEKCSFIVAAMDDQARYDGSCAQYMLSEEGEDEVEQLVAVVGEYCSDIERLKAHYGGFEEFAQSYPVDSTKNRGQLLSEPDPFLETFREEQCDSCARLENVQYYFSAQNLLISFRETLQPNDYSQELYSCLKGIVPVSEEPDSGRVSRTFVLVNDWKALFGNFDDVPVGVAVSGKKKSATSRETSNTVGATLQPPCTQGFIPCP